MTDPRDAARAQAAREWLTEEVCCDIAEAFQAFKKVPVHVVASLDAFVASREREAAEEMRRRCERVAREDVRESMKQPDSNRWDDAPAAGWRIADAIARLDLGETPTEPTT